MMRARVGLLLVGALLLGALGCSSDSGPKASSSSASPSPSSTSTSATGSSTSTTVDLGLIQSVDPTASDAESGGRAFARLYSAQLKQQARGAIDDTQTQCIEDQLIATFGGVRLLQLANTSYKSMPAEDFAKLVTVLQGCGLTQPTLDTLGVSRD